MAGGSAHTVPSVLR